MADSASELESDASSIDGGPTSKAITAAQFETLQKKVQTLQQEKQCLKMEVETLKLRCKALQEETRELRRASVTIQARAEQEEEFISNTLLKKIQALKNEKETLARNYEQEEEFLTNDLSRKLMQLRQEKCELEQTLEKEQECQINKLMRKIEKLEGETLSKQSTLEQLRREKVELENSLEQEQEALVNRLWKRMDKLEAEKRMLQEKLDQPVSAPPSPREMPMDGDIAGSLSTHISYLKTEVSKLKNQLLAAQAEHNEKMAQYAQEERHIREQNLRLQRKLQMEIERREALCRHLSESESSLEMDDERHFNEMSKQHEKVLSSSGGGSAFAAVVPSNTTPTGPGGGAVRPRNVSSPIPMQTSTSSRPLSPSMPLGQVAFTPPSPMRGTVYHSAPSYLPGTSPPVFSSQMHHAGAKSRISPSSDKFVKPAVPSSTPMSGIHPPAHGEDGSLRKT